jgi:hypothetical protein
MVLQKKKILHKSFVRGGKHVILAYKTHQEKTSFQRGAGYLFVPVEGGNFAPRTTHHAPRTTHHAPPFNLNTSFLSHLVFSKHACFSGIG